jgi:hypothetical protein
MGPAPERLCPSRPMFLSRRIPYFTRSTSVHRRDGKTNDEARPRGECVGGKQPSPDDRDVCHSIIAGAGGTGDMNLSHAVQSVARPGTSRIPASAMPSRARLVALHPSATAIKRLTEASSRKSTLSAKSETEPMVRATRRTHTVDCSQRCWLVTSTMHLGCGSRRQSHHHKPRSCALARTVSA